MADDDTVPTATADSVSQVTNLVGKALEPVPKYIEELIKPFDKVVQRGPLNGLLVVGGLLTVGTLIFNAVTQPPLRPLPINVSITAIITGSVLLVIAALFAVYDNHESRRYQLSATQLTISTQVELTQLGVANVVDIVKGGRKEITGTGNSPPATMRLWTGEQPNQRTEAGGE